MHISHAGHQMIHDTHEAADRAKLIPYPDTYRGNSPLKYGEGSVELRRGKQMFLSLPQHILLSTFPSGATYKDER
ncbi:uncharacterized protein EAF01_008071 [Botrytis porri]|uniref:uncharacterized protein n=1 Tax=Botrytis porri TaxID=87229 RepID=UPI0019000E32|nr:uncharacterized protein EAF01_008071 [Botrytis porri]KAF7898858.1 hypothetical protein EAF01_008071 [Botrytis porri]